MIVTGDSKQIDLLIRENKVRISRGLLQFEKATPKETSKDTKVSGDTKVPKDTKTAEQE